MKLSAFFCLFSLVLSLQAADFLDDVDIKRPEIRKLNWSREEKLYGYNPLRKNSFNVYLADCSYGGREDAFYRFLSSQTLLLASKRWVASGVLLVPCLKEEREGRGFSSEQLRFLTNTIRLYIDNRAFPMDRIHLFATTKRSPLAIALIETMPELFTSFTFVDSILNLEHPKRFLGIRMRGYFLKTSSNLSKAQQALKPLMELGGRVEFLKMDNQEQLETLPYRSDYIKWIDSISWAKK